MTIEIGFIVLVGGLIAMIFNKPLANSMMKYHPKENQARTLMIGRIAYVLAGGWLVVISASVLYRAM